MRTRLGLTVAAALLLSGCGDDGGSGSDAQPDTPTTTAASSEATETEQIDLARACEMIAAEFDNDTLSEASWSNNDTLFDRLLADADVETRRALAEISAATKLGVATINTLDFAEASAAFDSAVPELAGRCSGAGVEWNLS